MVPPQGGIVYGNKKEPTTDTCDITNESKSIMLSERSQRQKATCCRIQFIGHSEKEKTAGTEKRSVVARAGGG